MSVSGLTIFVIILNMLIGIAIPVGLCIFCRKKWKCDFLPFFTGCGVMFLFAFVLEQIVHMIVLYGPVGSAIQGNIWLYALYGGLMAGLFEETGRFVAMKFLLKKNHGNDYNALMYGAGHGGFEAFWILFFGMFNNLVYAVMINAGSANLLINGVDAANGAALQAAFEALSTTSPFLFLLSPVERIAAVVAQISLSVFVWQAAKEKGKPGWYLLAIFLHFVLDFVAVVLSGMGIPAVVIEVVIWLMVIGYALFAGKVWKSAKCADCTVPQA